MKYLIGRKGNFYKANLHTHTTVSDGEFTPEEIKNLYKQEGYSIVAFTDHNVIVTHNELSDEKFLAITSVEMNINEENKDPKFAKTYHLNFYSKDKNKTVSEIFNDLPIGNAGKYVTDEMRERKYNAKYSIESINEIIRKMKEDGFLVTYNHPVWSLQDYSDYIGLKGLWGIEVYNSVCERHASLKDTDAPFINFLSTGTNIIPIAADDTHKRVSLFGGFSIIEAKNLEYNEILSAMEKGDIYSTQGPLIQELSIEKGIVSIKTSPVARIILNTERRWARNIAGENVTFAKFDINDYLTENEENGSSSTFIRITLEDDKGLKAWTRAYSVNELK